MTYARHGFVWNILFYFIYLIDSDHKGAYAITHENTHKKYSKNKIKLIIKKYDNMSTNRSTWLKYAMDAG